MYGMEMDLLEVDGNNEVYCPHVLFEEHQFFLLGKLNHELGAELDVGAEPQAVHLKSQSKSQARCISLYQELMPGGVNSPVRAFKLVGGQPIVFDSVKGSRMWDIDGNEYIDYVGSWGPAIIGHADDEKSTAACSTWYWVLTLLQLPVAFVVFGYECVKLYKENKKRRMDGNPEQICEAAIEWNSTNLAFCAICGILGGTVGGLLGSGGGFILGPLLLEFGVIPQVASATATFVMMFSSSLSVVEFYLLKRFPIPYALYLMAVSILAGFWGQFLIRKMITILRRASLIVFILSGVIFASALTMGVIGIEKSIRMINNHEFMGFLDFCSSQ